MQPREIMRASEPIALIGAAFYFDPATLARGKEVGLDGFRFYFLGRGGVLGDVEADVVHAAFGYFHPAVVARMWNTGRERIAPRDAARLYHRCGHDYARARLAGVEGLDAFVDAAATLVGALEGASMPLFVATRAEPVPGDAPAAALHQAMVAREMRGSAHLVAIVATGLPTAVAHAIRRPDAVEMFGYRDDPPAVTDADRERWQRAEELTDAILEPAYASLTAAQAEAYVAGTEAIAAALEISSRPPVPRRA